MAKVGSIGRGLLKHAPWVALVLAVYQYYKSAGGIEGFLYDIKNLNMDVLQANWQKVGMSVACFVGAEKLTKFVPGQARYLVKAVLYYFGASMILDILQSMYSPAAITQGGAAPMEMRGY